MTNSQSLYWNGGVGDWADPANWSDPSGAQADTTPAANDTMYIAAGSVTIAPTDPTAYQTLQNETIYFGAPQGSAAATFDTSGETIGSGTVISLTGDYLNGAWTARGATDVAGAINVTGIDSQLTLSAVADSNGNAGVFTDDGAMTIGGEGFFDFASGTFQVNNNLLVRGQAIFEKGSNLVIGDSPITDVTANPVVQLAQDSSLVIDGSESGFGELNFAGADATLTLGDPNAFTGVITNFSGSDTLELSGIVANGANYNSNTDLLTLTNNGTPVYSVNVLLGKYTPTSFSVTNDGSSTTVTPDTARIVQDILPVPVFASVGQKVSLATILADAFGSTTNFGAVYVSYNGATVLRNSNWGYWTGSSGTLTTWTGPSITTPPTPETSTNLGASVTDFADTYLNIGNVIGPSAAITVPVVSNNGVVTEYLEYQINVVDPSLQGAASKTLTEPTPNQIVQSAAAFDGAYGNASTVDLEDCESIARDVAAAAGAVHGGNDINPDTNSLQTANLNQPDGFWRIAYDGGAVSNPTTNWFDDLRPGDIVRIGWDNGVGGITNGHTTTVLSVAKDHSSITVYDNADFATGPETIGIHTVDSSQWENTANPAYITVYRLRSDGRYLVNTQSANQTVYDTVYNDDVSLVGPGDTIHGGAGDELIEGPSADLQGVTLDHAHIGDSFQLDDATAASASYDQSTGALTISYTTTGGAQGTATITLDLSQPANFIVSPAAGASGEIVAIQAAGTSSPTANILWRYDNAANAADPLNGETYFWAMNGASVGSGAPTGLQAGLNWQVAGVDDFTGGGAPDILWRYDNAANAADPLNGDTYISVENGAATTPGFGPTTWQANQNWQIQGTGDFNGDGAADILWRYEDAANAADPLNGETYIWEMNGAQVLWSANAGPEFTSGFTSKQQTDQNWQVAGIDDFSGAGRADILWRYDNASNAADPMNGDLFMWTMNGTHVAAGASVGNPGANWQVAGTGDFDGDGSADVLFRYENAANAADPLNGMTYIDFMNGATVASGAPTTQQNDNSWAIAAIGDFNNDGKSDVLWRQSSTGATSVWEMNGANVASSDPTSWQVGQTWSVQTGRLLG
jgi:hypothetical protein